MLIARAAEGILRHALSVARSVVVTGPRQAGKSTLVRLVAEGLGGRVCRLDDPNVADLARGDPLALVRQGPFPLVLDEVQLVPELFRSVKLEVDLDPTPGRFILTGSARLDSMPALADALVGRADLLELAPFSRRELAGMTGTVLPTLRDDPERLVAMPASAVSADELLAGGFPELHARQGWSDKQRWVESYVTAVAMRATDELPGVEDAHALRRTLNALAAHRGGVLVVERLASDLGTPVTTLRRHLAMLRAVYLFEPLPGWAPGALAGARKQQRSPLADPALTAVLVGDDPSALDADRRRLGPYFEQAIVVELRRQATVSGSRWSMMHLRIADRHEVDLVIEAPDGRVIAIEVKASTTVGVSDARGLMYLRDRIGDRFAAGYVVHLGDITGSLGDRLWSINASSLWLSPAA